MSENLEYYRNQISIARTEIKNLRQQLCALRHEHQTEINFIKIKLSGLLCNDCNEKATTIVTKHNSEEQASSAEINSRISYQPIGFIETTFQSKRGVPRQPSILPRSIGTIVISPGIFNNPEHALSGLEEFSHMWILFHFHNTANKISAKVAPPRLDGERRGIFSTRAPHRPCPIGLSLVKIQNIVENKIHFYGVDMINGTPVLDIKPYIPQYDYPALFGDDSMSTLIRPPTEGISDAADSMAVLNIDDTNLSNTSVSPMVPSPIRIDTTSPHSICPIDNDIPSPDNRNLFMPVSPPSPDSPSSVDILNGSNYSVRPPLRRPDAERGAPDGQERFTPPQSAHLSNISHDGIRIAPWINNPPAQTYDVQFTDDALARLNDLIGERAHAFKSNIETLLSEDPRSHYVRNRYPDHEYSCVLEDVSISCIFDVTTAVCTIIAIRNAEELQEN